MSRHVRGHQAHDAADQEKPADHQGDGVGGDRRDYDGQDAQYDEDNALDQKHDPMLADGLSQCLLQLVEVARIRRHVRSPQTLWWLRRNSNTNMIPQYTGSTVRAPR